MNGIRKVLLADPVMVSHSLLYYDAALASTGFEKTQFTIAAVAHHAADRDRALAFTKRNPHVSLRLLEVELGPCITRFQCWRGFGRSMRAIEQLLSRESFDLVAYVAFDVLLIYLALPNFRSRFPAHACGHITGTLFRDNGLRLPVVRSTKGFARQWTDLVVLRRALRNPALKKVAFLDHWCADRARERFQTDKVGYGVDPVFHLPCDASAARAQFNLKPNDFAVLLFGVLSDRKGILETLSMLRAAPLPAEKTVIIVAGPSAPEIRSQLQSELEATALKYRLIRHDRFLETPEMPPYFAASDCVVCIYKDFSGSSSVLLHSATYGKPAIVSPGGAMEDAVRRYKFGEVVDIQDSAGFSRAIGKIAALNPNEREELSRRAKQYGAVMDARRYLSQFL